MSTLTFMLIFLAFAVLCLCGMWLLDVLIGDGMARYTVPRGWVGFIGSARWLKPYGLCSRKEWTISVNPPKWIPMLFGLRGWFADRTIWNHECLHAWGSRGCGSPWCLGYEGSKLKEYLAMPLQLLAGLRFCGVCKSFYRGEK